LCLKPHFRPCLLLFSVAKAVLPSGSKEKCIFVPLALDSSTLHAVRTLINICLKLTQETLKNKKRTCQIMKSHPSSTLFYAFFFALNNGIQAHFLFLCVWVHGGGGCESSCSDRTV
jgi:hypothetical protein